MKERNLLAEQHGRFRHICYLLGKREGLGLSVAVQLYSHVERRVVGGVGKRCVCLGGWGRREKDKEAKTKMKGDDKESRNRGREKEKKKTMK